MSILWCGGEDIDFPMGSVPAVTTNAASFRTGYARCAVSSPFSAGSTGFILSNPFPAASSLWFSCQVSTSSANYTKRWLSLTDNGAERIALKSKGSGLVMDVVLTDGTTDTAIGTVTISGLQRLDINVIYGANGSITIYKNGVSVFTWSGDTRNGGSTTLNGVLFGREVSYYISECIVADEDTRLFSLATLAPNAAGDVNTWTGNYTTINEITINDANEIYTNSTVQDAEFNMGDIPSGTFTIKAVQIAARAAKSAGATAGSIYLGVKSGGVSDLGASIAQGTVWATSQRLMQQNPVTANNWTTSDVNSLQLNFRSAT